MERDEAAKEAIRRLRETAVAVRAAKNENWLVDRIVDIVGDVCTVIGVALLLIFPPDPISIGLSLVGFGILGYNYLVRKPRNAVREEQRNREIDMLDLRIEQLERLLKRPPDGS